MPRANDSEPEEVNSQFPANEYQTTSPVLFLVFNRPDTTRQVFEAIRRARPSRLYVAADGPRPDKVGESDRCALVREIATQVDWDCDLKTLFRAENLGCGKAVSDAISWFFDQEAEGIILEDDCVPDPSFFPFVGELLDRYRDDSRVAIVSGNNFQPRPPRDNSSYYFSEFNHIWGWASWRRAWQYYDHSMRDWSSMKDEKRIENVLCSRVGARYWETQFEATSKGYIDSWGYRWTYSCWREGMVSVLPAVNLVKNIGFGGDATHTRGSNLNDPSSRTQAMTFPLKHPKHMIIDRRADDFTMKTRFRRPPVFFRALARILRSMMR